MKPARKLLAFFFLVLAIHPSFGDFEAATRRFGIFIGSNNGGPDRVLLRYARSDAQAVAQIFAEMGGIRAEDRIVLLEPSIRDIERQLTLLHQNLSEARGNYKRTELVFYYSGHSDEEGLLLNRQRYAYRDLRARINSLPSDMRIVILDSCASGAFTRAKGGVKTLPFLIDESISAEGYAFLTSSSATEASQESDLIEGSYFTHSLIAGLRGGADSVGDGRVTLNELYRFAYTETLARTEASVYGAQHPSYDMQISGSGDVVLTDVKETSAGLVFDADLTGRLTIRDSSDFLMAELTKVQNRILEIGLEPGLYRILLQRGDAFYRAEVVLVQDRRTRLNMAGFTPLGAAPATARGGPPETGAPAENLPIVPIKMQLIPDMWLGNQPVRAANHVLLGLVAADGWDLQGLGFAPLGIFNYGAVEGIQASGIYAGAAGNMTGIQVAGIVSAGDVMGLQHSGIASIASGNLIGVQTAGIFNMAWKDMQGVQTAGIFNMAWGDARGVQTAGIFNMAWKDMRGVQAAGIFNAAWGDARGLQSAGIFNLTSGALSGVQTGLVNISGSGSSGLRMGLVNISDGEKIVPLGLVNIIKDGIFSPQLWMDSMGYMNLGLKSGSRYVYSIISAGVDRFYIGDLAAGSGGSEDNTLVYRVGLGAELPLGSLFFDAEVSCGNIYKAGSFGESDFGEKSTLIIQGRLMAGFRFFKHLGAFAGLSYDYLKPFSGSAPVPPGGYALGWGDDWNIHRIGFFGGVQF